MQRHLRVRRAGGRIRHHPWRPRRVRRITDVAAPDPCGVHPGHQQRIAARRPPMAARAPDRLLRDAVGEPVRHVLAVRSGERPAGRPVSPHGVQRAAGHVRDQGAVGQGARVHHRSGRGDPTRRPAVGSHHPERALQREGHQPCGPVRGVGDHARRGLPGPHPPRRLLRRQLARCLVREVGSGGSASIRSVPFSYSQSLLTGSVPDVPRTKSTRAPSGETVNCRGTPSEKRRVRANWTGNRSAAVAEAPAGASEGEVMATP